MAPMAAALMAAAAAAAADLKGPRARCWVPRAAAPKEVKGERPVNFHQYHVPLPVVVQPAPFTLV